MIVSSVRTSETEKDEGVKLSAESMTDIAKMVSSMIEHTGDDKMEHHHTMHKELEDLDKRLSVVEALVKHFIGTK